MYKERKLNKAIKYILSVLRIDDFFVQKVRFDKAFLAVTAVTVSGETCTGIPVFHLY